MNSSNEIYAVDNDHHHVLSVNWEDGTPELDDQHKSTNTVPETVWHGRARQWRLPQAFREDAFLALLEEMEPIIQRVKQGYETEWNGSNFVGKMTEDALAAERELDALVEAFESDVQVLDFEDAYLPCTAKIKPHKTGDTHYRIQIPGAKEMRIYPGTRNPTLDRFARLLERDAATQTIDFVIRGSAQDFVRGLHDRLLPF